MATVFGRYGGGRTCNLWQDRKLGRLFGFGLQGQAASAIMKWISVEVVSPYEKAEISGTGR
ncbi:MAG TPA: hypothetical protein PLU87_14260 [Sedimentisphaerales bacterium]|nr:hypothetical protein [Sedimentisphaerales bacterium]